MKDLTQELVRELLHYNPENGVFTWRERDRKWFKTQRAFSAWNSQYPGKQAGYTRSGKTGYSTVRVRILFKDYLAHRLAFLYMEGDIPEAVDHINRDATDNRWRNLRAATSDLNHKNMSMNSKNTSGVNGVYWNKRRSKWHARGKIKGKHVHLGYFDELPDAEKSVLKFRQDNGFDREHGLTPAHYHT